MEVKAEHLSRFLMEEPVDLFRGQIFSFVQIKAEFRHDTFDPLPSRYPEASGAEGPCIPVPPRRELALASMNVSRGSLSKTARGLIEYTMPVTIFNSFIAPQQKHFTGPE
jgi:hypothetical protein